MTSRLAIALCLLLSLSGPSLGSGPSEPGGEAASEPADPAAASEPADPAAASEPADPAAPSSEGQDADDTPSETQSDDQDAAPIDVHRHRPGACPEGPPCQGDD